MLPRTTARPHAPEFFREISDRSYFGRLDTLSELRIIWFSFNLWFRFCIGNRVESTDRDATRATFSGGIQSG